MHSTSLFLLTGILAVSFLVLPVPAGSQEQAINEKFSPNAIRSSTAPTIEQAPSSQTVFAGADVVLNTVATGMEPLRYRWFLNGLAIAGATNSSLLLTNISPTQSGTYSLIVSNSAGVAHARARVQVETQDAAALPIQLTGWNADVIVEPQRSPLPTWWFDGGGWQWIAEGFRSFEGVHWDGLPASGRFTSAVNPNVVFQLQPFWANNVLLLSSPVSGGPDYTTPPDNPVGRLTLVQPARYSSLAIVAASGGLGGIGTVVLNFADGTSSREFPLMAPDWWIKTHSDYWIDPEPPGRPAIAGLGRVSRGRVYDNALGYGFGFYESDIDLAAAGLHTKTLVSLTFSKPPAITRKTGKGPITTGIFAVSGVFHGPYFIGIANEKSSGIQLKLRAPAGSVVRIESSDDLQTWKQVVTETVSEILEATDSQTNRPKTRFYRALQVE